MPDSRATTEALARMKHIDAAGELPFIARQSLIRSLVHLLNNDNRSIKFITLLGLACAKKSWPIWQSKFAAESLPMDLAKNAVSNLSKGSAIATDPQNDILRVKSYLDGKFLLGSKYFPAIYAGFSSWAVARDATFRYPLERTSADSERQVPPDEWDPCFLASLAVTGGAVWEGIGNPDVRREFWSWYLTMAAPQAFTEATEE